MMYVIFFFSLLSGVSFHTVPISSRAFLKTERRIRVLRASSCIICLYIALLTNCTNSSNLPWSMWQASKTLQSDPQTSFRES